MKKKQAFTLIEVVVVSSIIMILASIVIAGVRGARKKALRLQCMTNIRALGQATIIYAEDDSFGRLPYVSGHAVEANKGKAFGLIYDPVDFNDLNNFVCPSQRIKTIAANKTGSSYILSPHQNVSYNFVLDNAGAPQTSSYPLTNIILVENFSGTSVYTDADNHKSKGGSAFFFNGKSQFTGRNGKKLPQNFDRTGQTAYDITANSLYK